jgi:hypothetical protein
MGQLFSTRGVGCGGGAGRRVVRSPAELGRLWPAGILGMGVEQQAEYADAACRRGSTRRGFCEQQVAAVRGAFPGSPPADATGVGNLAYLALNAHPDFAQEMMNVHMAYVLLLRRRHGLAVCGPGPGPGPRPGLRRDMTCA